MNQEQIDAEELQPEMVIAVLREKIAIARKNVTGLRVDIQVVESVPGHSPEELASLNQQLAGARQARDAYQARLDAFNNTARGAPV